MLATLIFLLLKLTVAGSAMVAAVLLIRLILGRLLPKAFLAFLWMLAFVAFVIPVSLPIPGFAAGLVPRAGTVLVLPSISIPEAGVSRKPASSTVLPGAAEQQASSVSASVLADGTLQQPSRPAGGINLFEVAAAAYAGVAASLLVLFTILYILTLRRFRNLKPVEDCEVFRELCKKTGVRRPVPIDLSTGTTVPVTAGVFRARIFLPADFDLQNRELLGHICMHELMHVKRCDNAVSILMLAICCLHWFNPFAWFGYARFRREVELACDSAAVRWLGAQNRGPYARSLVLMAGKKKENRPIVFTTFAKQDIKERVTNVMKTGKLTARAFAACAISLLVASVSFGTVSCTKTAPKMESSISISSGVSDVPSAAVQQSASSSAAPGGKNVSSTVSGGVSEQKAPKMLQTFEKMSDKELTDKLSDLDLCVPYLRFSDSAQIPSELLVTFFGYEMSPGGDYPKDYEQKWYNKADGKYHIPVADIRQVLSRYFTTVSFDPARVYGYNKATGSFDSIVDGFGGARFPKLAGKRQLAVNTMAYTVGYYDEDYKLPQYFVTYTIRFDDNAYRYISIIQQGSSPDGSEKVAASPLVKADFATASAWPKSLLQDFAKENGFQIEANSGDSGILTLPKSFTQTLPANFQGNSKIGYSTRYKNVGAYFKQCNEKSRAYGYDFSGYLGQRVLLLSYDAKQSDDTSVYLYGLFDRYIMVGAWAETHDLTNDPRSSETYGGLLYRGESVSYSK